MRLRLVSLLILAALVGTLAAQTTTLATPVAQDSRELTVLVSAGQDTVSAFAYFPSAVQVRAGDLVTWKLNSDVPHTVSFTTGFVPEGPTRSVSFGPPGAASSRPAFPFREGSQA